MSEEEYLSSINQQENFKNNLHGAKEHILNQIKNLDIYQTHKENIDILIKTISIGNLRILKSLPIKSMTKQYV